MGLVGPRKEDVGPTRRECLLGGPLGQDSGANGMRGGDSTLLLLLLLPLLPRPIAQERLNGREGDRLEEAQGLSWDDGKGAFDDTFKKCYKLEGNVWK